MVFRSRYVGQGMREDLQIRNFGPEPTVCAGRGVHRRGLRRSLRGEGGPGPHRPRRRGDADGRRRLPRPLLPARATPSRGAAPLHRHFNRRRGRVGRRGRFAAVAATAAADPGPASVGGPRSDRGRRARPRQLVGLPGGRPGHRVVAGLAPLSLRAAGRAGDAVGADGPVAPARAACPDRPRRPADGRHPQCRGPRRAAHLRPRLPGADGRGGRCAVVHDRLRP